MTDPKKISNEAGDDLHFPATADNPAEEARKKKPPARKTGRLPKVLQTEEGKRFHINVPAEDQKKIKILQIALEISEDDVFLTAIRNLYKETILSGERI